VVEDVTEQRRLEAELAASEARFRAAVDGSVDAFLVLRAVRDAAGTPTDFTVVDANVVAAAQLGTAPDDLIGLSIGELYPTTRGTGLLAIYAQVLARGQRWEGEYRPTDPRLAARWFHLEVIPLGAALPDAIAVTSRDVTERRRMEAALRESEAQLSGVIGSAMDAIVTADASQRVVLFNRAAELMFGHRAEEILGQPLTRLLPDVAGMAKVAHAPSAAASAGGGRAGGARPALSARRADGSEFPIEASFSHVDVEAGRFYTIIVRDVTEQQRAEAALRALATRDELTGLLNRRGFRALAEQELKVGRRSGRRDAVIAVDLDDFKPVNDRWGHAAGDDALRLVAEVLRGAVREGDVVARLGGDEFVVYASGLAGAEEGHVLAARLTGALDARMARARDAGVPWQIGWSVGVAEVEAGDDLEALLGRADAQLYARKVARRVA
jgi:diguanylate cyclase (GGDEF)-like protein/PAS domain S-box-containing protein